MAIKMATWLSGNGAQPEFAPYLQRRMAGSAIFGGVDLSENWFHFPITTPVIIDDRRPKLTRFFVPYRMKFCSVLKIQLWSGDERVSAFDVPQESGLIRNTPDVNRNQHIEGKTMFNLDAANLREPIEVRKGLSISVKVKFDSSVHQQLLGQWLDLPRNIGTIEFFSVGADWELV